MDEDNKGNLMVTVTANRMAVERLRAEVERLTGLIEFLVLKDAATRRDGADSFALGRHDARHLQAAGERN
ncbi:MAG: hypothetical protein AB1705_09710 [Verrucomicrobiota bacterium]